MELTILILLEVLPLDPFLQERWDVSSLNAVGNPLGMRAAQDDLLQVEFWVEFEVPTFEGGNRSKISMTIGTIFSAILRLTIFFWRYGMLVKT